MTAHVGGAQSTGHSWTIVIVRDEDLDIDRREPPVTDLPKDIREALSRWLETRN